MWQSRASFSVTEMIFLVSWIRAVLIAHLRFEIDDFRLDPFLTFPEGRAIDVSMQIDIDQPVLLVGEALESPGDELCVRGPEPRPGAAYSNLIARKMSVRAARRAGNTAARIPARAATAT